MRVAVAAVLMAAALAGCQSPTGPGGGLGEDDAVFPFDGPGAHAWVEALVTHDGQPRYRVPGTPGHDQAADWLEGAMAMPGWTVRRISFSGQEYQQIEKPAAVAPYATDARNCLERDRQELAGLTFHNLEAVHRPAGDPGPMVLLGAHWDSKEEASLAQGEDFDQQSRLPVLGANDGASGVGVLLQLMHHVAVGEARLDFPVAVVFFDGEDGFEDCHPLAGSVHYAANMPPGTVSQMVLLDMVGDPQARFVREGYSMDSAPGVVDLLWHHGARAGLEANLGETRKRVIDDHVPFIAAGVPAVDIIDFGRDDTANGFPPYWHTRNDTMENIDAAMLGRVGSMVTTTLLDPAFAAATYPEAAAPTS